MDEARIRHAGRDRGGAARTCSPTREKRAAYAADVTYGTNSEFGFDYLRDNMASTLEEKVQHGGRPKPEEGQSPYHTFAIVDEVDNILIDEARTPLIISGAPEQAADLYAKSRSWRPRCSRARRRTAWTADQEGVRRRVRLRVRGEAQDRLDHRAGRRQGRALPEDRPSLPGRERAPGQPPDPGPEGRVALQARRTTTR